MFRNVDADFRRAMVATVLGEKLLTGRRRRPVRNWTQLQFFPCFTVNTYICSQENQQKLLPTELHCENLYFTRMIYPVAKTNGK